MPVLEGDPLLSLLQKHSPPLFLKRALSAAGSGLPCLLLRLFFDNLPYKLRVDESGRTPQFSLRDFSSPAQGRSLPSFGSAKWFTRPQPRSLGVQIRGWFFPSRDSRRRSDRAFGCTSSPPIPGLKSNETRPDQRPLRFSIAPSKATPSQSERD